MIRRLIKRIHKNLQVLNPVFLVEYYGFSKLARQSDERFYLSLKDRMVKMGDRTKVTGYDKHYIYHSA